MQFIFKIIAKLANYYFKINAVLKVLKLFICLFISLFSSVEVFSQDLTIQNPNICSATGSMASITVNATVSSPNYTWSYKTPSTSWVTISSANASSVYSTYNSATLNITKTPTSPVTETSYRVVVNGSLTSNEAVLTVDPTPVYRTITGASAVCAGEIKTFTYGANSVGAIQWQYSTTSPDVADYFIDIDGEIGGVYTANNLQETTWFRVKNTSGVCNPIYSPAVQVVVNSLPKAGYIEGGDISVCKTSNTTDLALIGYEGTIQWQKATALTGTYSLISLATNDTYTASKLTETTYFKAVVSSGVCEKVETDAVLITVDPTPISKTITGASAVCEGSSIELKYGSGSVGDIQWQSSSSGTADDFYDIDGKLGEIYLATDLQETTWFRVMNTSGVCIPIYSPAVQVVVNPLPAAGYIDGGDISVCKTSNLIELTLNDYEGTIQWQKALDAGGSPGTFANITSATKDTYTASNLTATTYFKAVVSSGVCEKVETDAVLITVDPTPISKTITGPLPLAVCEGSSIELKYGAGSVGDMVWQSSTSGTVDDFYDIDGKSGEIYLVTDLQETTWFRVMNTSGEVCDPKYSLAVKVLYYPLSAAGYIDGGDISVCKTSNVTDLTLNYYEGTIQWQKALDIGGSPGTFANITSAIKETYTASNLTATTYFRAIVSSGVCSSEITDPVVITVDSTPVSKTITGASAVCAGGSKTLTYGSGSVGDIQWQRSITSSSTGFVDIDGETEGVYIATNLQESAWYRVMNSSGVCNPIYSPAVQVVVNLKPVVGNIEGGNVNICKTVNSTILTLNNSVGTIQWQKATALTGTYTKISSATSARFIAASLLATTYFRAVLSSGVCAQAITTPIVLTVEPTSTSKLITGASAICSGGSKTLIYGTGSIGAIQWQRSITSSSTGFVDISNEKAISYSTTDLQKTTWYRVKNGTCTPVYSKSVQVVVNPSTTPTFDQVGAVCSGAILAALPQISTNAIAGTWSPLINNTTTTTYTFTPTAGVCVNTTTTTITVNTTPPPTGEENQSFNSDVPKSIRDLVVVGSNLHWYSSLENAIANINSLDLNTILIKGNTYYAMQTISGCTSNSPLAVFVGDNLGTTIFDFKELQFYPNPVKDYFTLTYSEIISDIQLFNIMGQSVFIAHPKALNPTLNIDYLPAGTYYMEVKSNNKKAIVKIIKK